MSDKEKHGVEYEGTVPLDTLLSYLDDLRSRLESGQVQVDNGASSLVLIPGTSIRLKVRAREKNDEQSLRFEMAWQRSEPVAKANGLAFTAPNGSDPAAPNGNGKGRRSKKS